MVEDKTDLCSKWKKAGACRLDTHFPIDAGLNEIYADSKDMFDFMQKACPNTCGWTESGCHDEHPRCQVWSRLGHCVSSPTFMAHTCRESCGVCGFLSPHNKVSRLLVISVMNISQGNTRDGREVIH